ncbi:MAG TPA: DUF4145 domain-containing protein [Pirellulales bacterium]|nr:DUF4145 domain-containing protein [Pirellulales bacterium]
MTASQPTRYDLESYQDLAQAPPFFRLRATPTFSPVDINVAFLLRSGWTQAVDRLRLHITVAHDVISKSHPLAKLIGSLEPHLLVRRLDRESQSFVAVSIRIDGQIEVRSNDQVYARKFVAGLCLECPPGFHTLDELEIDETWESEPGAKAMFAGMLAGAFGWDPTHGVPESVRESLEEAHKSLEIDNYRSCVVMSRRTIEAILRFGFPRLLKKPAVDNKGKGLMLDSMIKTFRAASPSPIPQHLLSIADALRLIGNVPGAHAADIEGYQFTRSDAEFAFYAVNHFVDQYFSKIDQEVTQYYTLTISLSPDESA